ncbi:MAG: hypothetical protein RI885_2184 [Actinomycetota bacterium]
MRSHPPAAALLLVAVLAVSACSSSGDPQPSESPVASPSGPEPSASPDADDDTVFSVDAKVRAVDGTTMEISLVGHVPLASTDPDAARLVSDFVERCGALGGTSPSDVTVPVSEESLAESGSSLMLLEFSATPDGHTFFAPLDLGLGSQYAPKIAFGDTTQAVSTNESCIGLYQVTGSGMTTAITDYESPSGTPDPSLWVTGYYGFSVPVDSGASIESCRASVSPAGLADTEDAPGWDAGTLVSGVSCGIGYIGE